MTHIGHQCILRLADDRVIAPSVAARRTLARTISEVGKDLGLILFSAPDTHIHLDSDRGEAQTIELGRRVKLALSARLDLPVPFSPSRVVPIRDQRHLLHHVDYFFGNASRHGSRADPHLEGSNVLDLLGARLVAGYTRQRVLELLPRFRLEGLLRHLGIEVLEPGTNPAHLVDSAAAAFAVPDLAGRSAVVVRAKLGAAHVGRRLGLSARQISSKLGLSARQASRLLLASPEPVVVRAIEFQMGLRERVPLTRAGTPAAIR